MNAFIAEHLDAIRSLCEKHSVERLYLIGSALGDDFDPAQSDVDFVVEFLPNPPGRGFDHPYFKLNRELEELFNRHVDLIDANAIENRFFRRSYERTREALYAA